MATLRQLLVSVQQQVQTVCTGLQVFNAPLKVQVGLDWPPPRVLQGITKMSPPTALVSVYDRKTGHDSTRWLPSYTALNPVAATTTSAPTQQYLAPLGTCQLTIGGTCTINDAVSLVVYMPQLRALQDPGDGSYTAAPTAAIVVGARAGATPATLAAALAASAAGGGLAAPVAVLASGNVLTITSQSTGPMVVSSYVGNGGTVLTEIARRVRDVQLSIWSGSPEVRDTASNPVEALLAQIETFRGPSGAFQAGLPLGDGSFGTVRHKNDFIIDDPTISDLYRRDFIFSVDYPVTVFDNMYSVLAPILQYNVGMNYGQFPPGSIV